MKIVRFGILSALSVLLLLSASCAGRRAEGPMVTLYESGKIRQVPAGDFTEASYLERGYIKNTDSQGNTIYVFVPEDDFPEEPAYYNYRDPRVRGGGGLDVGFIFLGDSS